MVKETASLSLADLEKLMEERQAQVEALLKKREQVVVEIESLDAEIKDFLTGGPSVRRGKRAKNAAPLRTVMLEVLGKNKKGLSLHDLSQQISSTGYKSNSRNFKNVVYQCLYNTKSVVHDEATGLYRVVK
jgi:hypothetical protein